MNEGDVLFYIDIGCEFQIEGKRRLQEMIDEIRKNEIMGVMVVNITSKKYGQKQVYFSILAF